MSRDHIFVVTGESFGAFLTEEGELSMVANNDEKATPIGLDVFLYSKEKILRVYARTGNHLIIRTNRRLLVSGNDCYGQCSDWKKLENPIQLEPVKLKFSHLYSANLETFHEIVPPEGKEIFEIFVGMYNTIIRTNNGFYGWGANDYGQFGIGHHRSTDSAEELKINSGKEVILKASCGRSFILLLTQSGKVYGSGLNQTGQLGIGKFSERETKFRLMENFELSNEKIVEDLYVTNICAGQRHSLVMDIKGRVFSCGDNKQHQLGLGIDRNVKAPKEISTLKGLRIKTIRGLMDVSGFITKDNNIYLSGDIGCLCDNKYIPIKRNRKIPVLVKFPVRMVDFGYQEDFFLFAGADGKAYVLNTTKSKLIQIEDLKLFTPKVKMKILSNLVNLKYIDLRIRFQEY